MTASARARLVPAFFALAFAVLPATHAQAGKKNTPNYSYWLFPKPAGTTYVDPTSINQHNLVVGDYFSASTSVAFEFVNGGYFKLPKPSSTTRYNRPTGINDKGSIAGDFFDNSTNWLNGGHGYLLPDDDYVLLAARPTPTTTYIEVHAISDKFDIVGDYFDKTGGVGFVSHNDGDNNKDDNKYTVLPKPTPSTTYIEPTSIANDKIVGVYYDSVAPGSHGFVYSKKGYKNLPLPTAATTYVRPQGINDRGEIVGLFYEGSTAKGFAYTKHGYFIVNLPNNTTSYVEPKDVNDHGTLVGLYYDNTGAHGFATVLVKKHDNDGDMDSDDENCDWDSWNHGPHDWEWQKDKNWDWHW